MSNGLEGSKIIELFNASFDTEDSLEQVDTLCEQAEQHIENDPGRAIAYYQEALQIIDQESKTTKAALEIPYSTGKCYLLLASIYLNGNTDLSQAETYYIKSHKIFTSRRWPHLEALALFGLAITRRKLKQYKEAYHTCQRAHNRIIPELTPEQVRLNQLKAAISQEESIIERLKSTRTVSAPAEKTLPIFKILAGQDVITAGNTTDANFLSRREYQQVSQPEQAVIDVDQVQAARYADYILEIDEQVDQAADGLNKGDWLLIREEENSDRLSHNRVAVLLQQNGQNQVSLKTFTKVRNHFFLEATHPHIASVAVVDFDGDFDKVSNFYKNFGRPVDVVWVYSVRISGIVVDHIPKAEINTSYILEIPILDDISAGLGTSVESNVVDYCVVRANRPAKDNFGVSVVGNSMNNDNILDGDIVLFHPQPTVKQGEIAAVVITPLKMNPLGVIKRYRIIHENRSDMRHWLLESSNPSSPHLVVMPSGVNEAAIEQMYTKSVKAGKIVQPEFYRSAKASVAGKYIGKCEEGVLEV